MKRSHEESAPTLNHEEKQKLYSKLISRSGSSRKALAGVLKELHQRGLLTDEHLAGGVSEEKAIQKAVSIHARAETPYGTVVQHWDFGVAGFPPWPYIHPLALLFYLTSISNGFAVLMADTIRNSAGKLTIILYDDGFIPGNPLRSDGGRSMLGCYWFFLEWPSWLLCKASWWLPFGYIRNSKVEQINGGSSAIRRLMLRILFVNQSTNFRIGAMIMYKGAVVMFTACFGGNLGDEKGLKETYEIFGQAGMKPCLTCKTTTRFRETAGTRFVDISCTDPRQFILHTNESIYDMVDKLIEKKQTMSPTDFDTLQQHYGLHYAPAGMLFDPSLRDVVKPVDHYLRDWMHTLMSQGVAGTELALLFAVVVLHGFPPHRIQTFASHWHQPKTQGKIPSTWFDPKFIAADHVKYFAGELLSIVRIFLAFLLLDVAPKVQGKLDRHIRCFTLLVQIIGNFSNGPEVVTRTLYEKVQGMIEEHARLFVELYGEGAAKIKFHHLLHLMWNVFKLGKMIGCFPGERKHREAKAEALWGFRNIEVTVTNSMVNNLCNDAIQTDAFHPIRMVSPQNTGIEGLMRSSSARLPCGEVSRGDVVLLTDQQVGEVLGFWLDTDSNCIVQIQCYTRGDDESSWQCVGDIVWLEACNVLDALTWAFRRPGLIRILLPMN